VLKFALLPHHSNNHRERRLKLRLFCLQQGFVGADDVLSLLVEILLPLDQALEHVKDQFLIAVNQNSDHSNDGQEHLGPF